MTGTPTFWRAGSDAAYLRELAQAVRRTDKAALVAEGHVVTRIIRHDRRMTGFLLRVPHERCYWLSREALDEIADPDEVNVEDIRPLPQTVILLACPPPGQLASLSRAEALLVLEQELFHARVHLAIQRRLEEGKLTEAILRQRIHRIGQTEFNEARFVLQREHLLLPPRDIPTVYAEFAATYLELRHFAGPLLGRYFPAIWHAQDVEAILGDDVDVPSLLAASRIPGAASPSAPLAAPPPVPACSATWPTGTVSPARRLKRLARADDAQARGNTVRAAILRAQAGQARTGQPLDALARRLGGVLDLGEDQLARWREALAPLLAPASRGYWPIEARLLYQLQRACIDHEQELFSVDAAAWVLDAGRQPLRRPLPVKRQVLIVTHLRGAMAKLAGATLDESHRQVLESLLHQGVEHCEGRLREHLRGELNDAMVQSGLEPGNVPETVACDKIVEELIDRVTERGVLAMGDLRDAISRNSFKLPDLGGPLRPRGKGMAAMVRAWAAWFLAAVIEMARGGRLLALDRKFSVVLDGAYHRSEFYMRWLHRLSLLGFGTWLGRALTLYALLPFVGAFVILEGLQHLVHLVLSPFWPVDVELNSPPMLAGMALYLIALIHLRFVRKATRRFFLDLLRLARLVLLEGPRWLASREIVRRLVRSGPVQFFRAHVAGPLLVTFLAWWALRRWGIRRDTAIVLTGAVAVVSSIVLNTRAGRRLQELISSRAAHAWQYMRTNILWGTILFTIEVFKRGLELLERMLYAIDEWLRFRGGDSRWSLVAKSALGVPWFLISYILRFMVNLLIEPQVNPVKHFPVVTVSHKLLLPTIPAAGRLLAQTFSMTPVLANTVATTVIGSIPGFFGFLAWELMGNWRLYRANRPRDLARVAVGSHAETMVRLMKPGLHSGTLPKLYAKMRHAEARAAAGKLSPKVRKLREHARRTEESLRRFAQRELIRLLTLSRGWQGRQIRAGQVRLGSNRIALELLGCPGDPEPMWVAFEEQAGWLLAGIARCGWLAQLAPSQRQTLAAALAGFYKAAGVDIVREQLEASFAPVQVAYDIAEKALVVWPGPGGAGSVGGGYENEIVYDLQGRRLLLPQVRQGGPSPMPPPDARLLFFRDIPISWQEWVVVWDFDQVDALWPDPIARGTRILPEA